MNKHFSNRLVGHSQGKETIMANVSKVILGAAIAAVSLASPALAAHKAKPIHQNGYVTQSSQGSGVRAFASVPRSVDDPAITGGGSSGYNQSLRLNQW
jgi:opacity protein-like surface antigen